MVLKKAGLLAIIITAAAIVSVIVAVQVLQPLEGNGSGEAIPGGQTESPSQGSAGSASAQEPGLVLKLSAASVPIDIPMTKAFESGNDIYLIATDASDAELAEQLTDIMSFKVNTASVLAQTPEEARGQVYIFRNGVEGDGPLGFQPAVVNAKPGDEDYSPLLELNYADWESGSSPTVLTSIDEIMEAESTGQLTVTETDAIVNHPAVMWNGGSLMIREDRGSINDDSPYMGGQVLDIDTDSMVATFVAHRGWGPDGKTIYYIVTDATPEDPANMMGVPLVQADERLAGTPVAVDLFQFINGIEGSGPMGFQAGIGGANPTDVNYSPMWKISFIEWKDPSGARLLETLADINTNGEEGTITVTPAMDGLHVVNCPFYDQETVFEHRSDRF